MTWRRLTGCRDKRAWERECSNCLYGRNSRGRRGAVAGQVWRRRDNWRIVGLQGLDGDSRTIDVFMYTLYSSGCECLHVSGVSMKCSSRGLSPKTCSEKESLSKHVCNCNPACSKCKEEMDPKRRLTNPPLL